LCQKRVFRGSAILDNQKSKEQKKKNQKRSIRKRRTERKGGKTTRGKSEGGRIKTGTLVSDGPNLNWEFSPEKRNKGIWCGGGATKTKVEFGRGTGGTKHISSKMKQQEKKKKKKKIGGNLSKKKPEKLKQFFHTKRCRLTKKKVGKTWWLTTKGGGPGVMGRQLGEETANNNNVGENQSERIRGVCRKE